jgi:hypothetical protein
VVTLNNLCNVLEQDLELHECLARLDQIPDLMPAYEAAVGPERVLAATWATSVKRSSICAMLGQSAQAHAAAESAVTAAEQLGGEHQLVTALLARAAAGIDLGHLDTASADLDRAAGLAGDGPLLGDVRQHETVLALARRDLDLAGDLVRDSLQRTEQHEALRTASRLMWRAEVELRRNDDAGALATVRHALRLVTEHELGEPIVGLLHQTSRLLEARGRNDEAARVRSEMRAVSARSGQIVSVTIGDIEVVAAVDPIDVSADVEPFGAARRAASVLEAE